MKHSIEHIDFGLYFVQQLVRQLELENAADRCQSQSDKVVTCKQELDEDTQYK